VKRKELGLHVSELDFLLAGAGRAKPLEVDAVAVSEIVVGVGERIRLGPEHDTSNRDCAV